MNNTIFSLVAILVIFLSFVSCNENNNSTENHVRTENDFFNDPSLTADPEKDLVVMFLEPPDALPEENQTGELGNDIFTFRYKRSINNTFCWKDEDGEAGHFMELDDIEGNHIFRLDVNGECTTALLEKGDYVMHIHHDARIDKTLPIFIIPNPEDMEQAGETDGLINRFRLAAASILNGIQKTVTKNAVAQSSVTDTLINTNECVNCDLTNADLSGALLNGAIVTGANLTDANLTDAILFDADLTDAILFDADLTSANLIGANLTSANLTGAYLTLADLTSANLTDAILTGADLTDAILTGADLTDAILTGAVWCNGCICADPSIGTCAGCAPQEACTGS